MKVNDPVLITDELMQAVAHILETNLNEVVPPVANRFTVVATFTLVEEDAGAQLAAGVQLH